MLGVTILTSLNNKSLKEIGHTKSVKQLVLKQAYLIKKSGCDGIVCSAQEAKMVRKKFKKLFIVTPGIRLPGDSANDQSRVMTPNDAFKNKVSGIVMGRSLIKGNIKKKSKSINKDLKVFGVTVLTSLNNNSLKEMGHTKSVEQLVLKQAGLIKKSGCDGIVCSAQEAEIVRKKYKNLFIVTPGIRLPGDSTNDQSRVMTPNNAFKNKVSGIVMGRSIIKGNVKNNIQRLIDHLNKWLRGLKSVGSQILILLIL